MNNEFVIFRYRFSQSITVIDYFEKRYPRLLKKWDNDLAALITKRIKVNGRDISVNGRFEVDDILEYKHYKQDEKKLANIEIIYENEDLLVIEKPTGYPVIPNSDFHFNSITNFLRSKHKNQEISPLHRLDLETSGVLLFAKRKEIRGKYQSLFQERKVDKYYTAVVHGLFPDEIHSISGKIVKDLDSKILSKLTLVSGNDETITSILSSKKMTDKTVLKLKPVTGFRNQIRVHLRSVGHPIVGDKKYGFDENNYLDWLKRPVVEEKERLMLHCDEIRLDALHFKSVKDLNNDEII
jgi:RluA family pseudouridine synthase